MPTYEYECKEHGIIEIFQLMTAEKLKKCPKCGKAIKRLISKGAGLILKGSGFYQNDYKRHKSSVINRPKKKSVKEGYGQWSPEAQAQMGKVDKGNREDFKKEKMVQELSEDGFNEAAISGMTKESESSVKTMIKNKGNIHLDGKY